MIDILFPEERELYEERAAIREYMGGQSRYEAERDAMREVLERRAAQPKPRRTMPLPASCVKRGGA